MYLEASSANKLKKCFFKDSLSLSEYCLDQPIKVHVDIGSYKSSKQDIYLNMTGKETSGRFEFISSIDGIVASDK